MLKHSNRKFPAATVGDTKGATAKDNVTLWGAVVKRTKNYATQDVMPALAVQISNILKYRIEFFDKATKDAINYLKCLVSNFLTR